MYLLMLVRPVTCSGLGFSVILVTLSSSTVSAPPLRSASYGWSMAKRADSSSFLTAFKRASAEDSPFGFQTKSSPMKTRTGSFKLYSSATMATGTAVPYLAEGSWEVKWILTSSGKVLASFNLSSLPRSSR